MIRTLRGWFSEAWNAAWRPFGEPITAVLVAALFGVAFWLHRRNPWTVGRWLAYTGFAVWLVAALGVTIYPIRAYVDLSLTERWEVQSFIPLAGTIESFGNMRDRTLTPEELALFRSQIAEASGVSPEEVVLDPQLPGASLSTVLRDPVGNMLLFMPLGLVAPVGLRLRNWRKVAGTAAVISGAIELSQLLLGLGSLGTIDDVIFNTAGALLGLGLLRLLMLWWHRRPNGVASPALSPAQ